MTRLGSLFLAFVFLTPFATAAQKGPDIRVIDDRVSIHADSVPLGRLLRLLDFATGMASKVPPELMNRNVSVQFSDLDVDAAVRKIFEGQAMDYVFITGQGIMVTAVSQSGPVNNGGGAAATPFPRDPSPFEPQPSFPQNFPQEQPAFLPNAVPNNQNIAIDQQQQQQPAMIQTPFGPIPNPRLQQGQQQQPNAPLNGPGGGNPFGTPFGGATPFGAGQPYPGAMPPNPFGAPPTASAPGAGPISPISTAPLAPQPQTPK